MAFVQRILSVFRHELSKVIQKVGFIYDNIVFEKSQLFLMQTPYEHIIWRSNLFVHRVHIGPILFIYAYISGWIGFAVMIWIICIE